MASLHFSQGQASTITRRHGSAFDLEQITDAP
jgi:hypothetical protein